MDSANGHPPAVVAAASSPMRDAHNQQALGVLLNSKVKQVRQTGPSQSQICIKSTTFMFMFTFLLTNPVHARPEFS